MRLAASIVATLAIAGLAAGCTEHPRQHHPRHGGLLPERAPTVTLTEPAGGPVKDGT
ncbi:hypothetical protein ABZ639_15850 [Saccharomonospora sp. NPDC006951]